MRCIIAVLLFSLVGCYPPRDSNGHQYKPSQVWKRIWAARYKDSTKIHAYSEYRRRLKSGIESEKTLTKQ